MSVLQDIAPPKRSPSQPSPPSVPTQTNKLFYPKSEYDIMLTDSNANKIKLLEGAADNDARISMGLVESINTAQQEYNQCVSRQQKLVNDLKTKRSDRLGSQIKQNASIVNLIQAWKEEESRVKMIKLAEMRKRTLDEEITKLEGMDELKCRILGISKQEILNG